MIPELRLHFLCRFSFSGGEPRCMLLMIVSRPFSVFPTDSAPLACILPCSLLLSDH